MNRDIEISWLAGLLEGEGSFMMNRNIVNGKVYLYPKIIVTMTDEDVIDRASLIMGNPTYKIPNKRPEDRKQQWRTQVSGAKAAALMKELLPHMGIRRAAKIQDLLESYGEIEPTNVRRARNCSIAAKKRWAKYGTREGRL